MVEILSKIQRQIQSSRKHRIGLVVLVAMVLATIWKLLLFNEIMQSSPKLPTYSDMPNIPQDATLPEDAAFSTELKTKLCSELPISESFLTMTGSPAFIDISPPYKISAGGSVCVRVVVPAFSTNTSLSYAPFPGAPWDSILVDMVGNNTGISIPVVLQPSNRAQNYIRDSTHIYEADVVLRDADTYTPTGYIEYRNGLWNNEEHIERPPMIPEQLLVNSLVTVEDGALNDFSLNNYLNLPLCTEPNADGRWISVDKLPFNTTLAPDNYNRVWLPYSCQLQPYTYQEFAQCLQQKHSLIHWFGDSNTRRALKKITTFGQWCSEPNRINSVQCICHDSAERFGVYNSNSPVIPIDIDSAMAVSSPALDGNIGTVPANKSRIIMFRWGGLTPRNNPPWPDTFSTNFTQQMGSPSVAIFGLINWDTAFTTRSYFIQQVELLADYILHNYSNQTQITIRTGQYYCCTYDQVPNFKRMYTRLRNQYFNQYLIDILQAKLGTNYSISIWDVSQIAERRPYAAREEMALACPSNHVRAELVDIENTLLMNHLCN
ncbi:hypothetical protein IWW36_004315 [Coemansia brasiliensis]|uniref:Uncharacterized protein n=1 Tax=Coemansia brasiliensis TaxID=2650707 RepID=A0A9W8LXQ1_9FUNG|nr:hypothetical protein IWW36_004315 [Coemansia brasiliensis]